MIKQVSTHNIFMTAVRIVTLTVFITTNTIIPLGNCYGQGFSVFTDMPLPVTGTEDALFPEKYGKIIDSYNGESDKFVFYIQDAHCNYPAQKSLSKIIEYIINEENVGIINLEGGSGPYDTSVFDNISNEVIREEVSEYFLKNGEINGAEFYAVNNPSEVALWGIEDPDLYLKNLKVYRDFTKNEETVNKSLEYLDYILNKLKLKVFDKELMEMDILYSRYRHKNIEIIEYIKSILKISEKLSVDIEKYDNIQKLVLSVDMEKDLNFKKAGRERDKIVDILKEKLSKNELNDLISKTISLKTGDISPRDFYIYIMGKARLGGIDLSKYRDFLNYVTYIRTYESIDPMSVTKEIGYVEDDIFNVLCDTEQKKKLQGFSRRLTILRKLFSVRLTEEEYSYYTENKNEFEIASLLSFLRKETSEQGIDIDIKDVPVDMDKYRGDIEMFYEYSFERDRAFIKNLKFDSSSNKTVLVTGGFHSENLYRLLKEEGISFLSIVPKFRINEGVDYNVIYFNLLKGGTSSLLNMVQTEIFGVSAMMIASKLSALGEAVWGKDNIAVFEVAGAILEKLSQQIRETEAAEGKDKHTELKDINITEVLPVRIVGGNIQVTVKVSGVENAITVETPLPRDLTEISGTGYPADNVFFGGLIGKNAGTGERERMERRLTAQIEEGASAGELSDRFRALNVDTGAIAGFIEKNKDDILSALSESEGLAAKADGAEIDFMKKFPDRLIMTMLKRLYPGRLSNAAEKSVTEFLENAVRDPSGSFGFFESIIENGNNYILGSESALAVDVMEYLNQIDPGGERGLIAEYMLHEILEKTWMSHREIIELTTKLFGREKLPKKTIDGRDTGDETTPLGQALSDYISYSELVSDSNRHLEDTLLEALASDRFPESLRSAMEGKIDGGEVKTGTYLYRSKDGNTAETGSLDILDEMFRETPEKGERRMGILYETASGEVGIITGISRVHQTMENIVRERAGLGAGFHEVKISFGDQQTLFDGRPLEDTVGSMSADMAALARKVEKEAVKAKDRNSDLVLLDDSEQAVLFLDPVSKKVAYFAMDSLASNRGEGERIPHSDIINELNQQMLEGILALDSGREPSGVLAMINDRLGSDEKIYEAVSGGNIRILRYNGQIDKLAEMARSMGTEGRIDILNEGADILRLDIGKVGDRYNNPVGVSGAITTSYNNIDELRTARNNNVRLYNAFARLRQGKETGILVPAESADSFLEKAGEYSLISKTHHNFEVMPISETLDEIDIDGPMVKQLDISDEKLNASRIRFQDGNKSATLEQLDMKELEALGVTVPPGVVLTTRFQSEYEKNGDSITPEMRKELRDAAGRFTSSGGGRAFFSVRSGAAASMPGLMDTVTDISINGWITQDDITGTYAAFQESARETGLRDFSPAGDILNIMTQRGLLEPSDNKVILFSDSLADILDSDKDDIEKAEELGKAMGYEGPAVALYYLVNSVYDKRGVIRAVGTVLDSWYSDNAESYRRANNISSSLNTAVLLHSMVFGDPDNEVYSQVYRGESESSGKGEYLAGTIFFSRTNNGDMKMIGQYKERASGEATVGGAGRGLVDVDKLKDTNRPLYDKLMKLGEYLEKEFLYPQDVEFTVENGKFYLMQTRNAKAVGVDAVSRALRDYVDKGLMSQEKARKIILPMLEAYNVSTLREAYMRNTRSIEGIPAVSGAAIGYPAFNRDDIERLKSEGKSVIYVSEKADTGDVKMIRETRPDGIVIMADAKNSHAAIQSSTIGVPMISRMGRSFLADDTFLEINDAGDGISAVVNGEKFPVNRDSLLAFDGEGRLYILDGGKGVTEKSDYIRSSAISSERISQIRSDSSFTIDKIVQEIDILKNDIVLEGIIDKKISELLSSGRQLPEFRVIRGIIYSRLKENRMTDYLLSSGKTDRLEKYAEEILFEIYESQVSRLRDAGAPYFQEEAIPVTRSEDQKKMTGVGDIITSEGNKGEATIKFIAGMDSSGKVTTGFGVDPGADAWPHKFIAYEAGLVDGAGDKFDAYNERLLIKVQAFYFDGEYEEMTLNFTDYNGEYAMAKSDSKLETDPAKRDAALLRKNRLIARYASAFSHLMHGMGFMSDLDKFLGGKDLVIESEEGPLTSDLLPEVLKYILDNDLYNVSETDSNGFSFLPIAGSREEFLEIFSDALAGGEKIRTLEFYGTEGAMPHDSRGRGPIAGGRWKDSIEDIDVLDSAPGGVTGTLEKNAGALLGRITDAGNKEVFKRLISEKLRENGADPEIALTRAESAVDTVAGILSAPLDSFNFFNAIVEDPVNYILGNQSALAINVLQYLSRVEGSEGYPSDLVQEYILHEALENIAGLNHNEIIGITTAFFGRANYGSADDGGLIDKTGPLRQGDDKTTYLGDALGNFIDFYSFLNAPSRLEEMGDEELESYLTSRKVPRELVSAVNAEAAVRQLKKAVNVIKPDNSPNIIFVPKSEDQLLFEASYDSRNAQEVKRTMDRKYGKLTVVYFYDDKGDLSDIESRVSRIRSDVTKDPNTRIIFFSNPDTREAVSSKIEETMPELKDNIVGVVNGTFAPGEGEEDQRYSLTTLAIFAIGMMDYNRNIERDPGYAELIAGEVKDLFGILSSNVEVTAGMPPGEIISRLLSGNILLAIKKIEYEEIRDYMEAESQVLMSL